MNRAEFMKELESLLQDISEAERAEALQYYNDYFDDAGKDNEDIIIRELGSPWRVAGIIRESIDGTAGDRGTSAGEFTEQGYEDHRYEKTPDMPQTVHKKDYDPKSRRLLLIIVAVFAIALLPIRLGGLGTVFGVIVALIAIFFFIGIVSVALMIGGGITFIVGLTRAVVWLPEAIVTCGMGLILFAVGLVLLAVSIFVYKKVIPGIVRWAVSIGRRFLKRGGERDE